MKGISIEGYSFHGLLGEGRMDMFHMLETLQYRYRVNAVGIWNGFFPSTEDGYVQKIATELKQRGMILSNLAVDGANVWHDNESKRVQNHETAKRYLAIAEKLGAKSVRIDWGVPREELAPEEEDLIVRRFREYSNFAHNAGFILCAENHAGAARNPHFMKRVLEEINHPAYRILLHAGSWYCDTEIGDEIVMPYAAHTHVMQKVVESARLRELLSLFSKYNYQGYLGVEQHGGKHEYEVVEWQVATVRKELALFSAERIALNG